MASPALSQFRQKPRLAVDSVGRPSAQRAAAAAFPHRIWVSLRYLLAIGGLLLGVAAIAGLWLFLPRSEAPVSATMVAAAPAAEPAAEPIEAEVGGEGTFRVCNDTANPVSIAFGYRAERGWQSEGWWVANPTECKTLYSGDVGARRYYYIYAADDISGGTWDGKIFMCTRDESFTIFGVEDCLARGYERTGFFEIDTQGRSSWMLRLTDNQVPGAESEDGTDADVPLEGDVDVPLEGEPDGEAEGVIAE
jgi:uncharacterized membrane protein